MRASIFPVFRLVLPRFSTNDFPVHDAVVQTLEAVWSDLFAMVSGTALEADAEDLGWAFVNIFHRSATRKSTAVDRATDEVRALLATADGSEIHTHELETQVERAQCAEGAMIALEEMREVAAALYLNEFGSSWKPVSSSRFNHSAMLTSALVEGREFVRARSEAKRRAAMPEGTPVIFAGGRTRHPNEQDALTFANNVWATLDKVHDRVPDMVLVHGGDTKGVDRLASSWAERRNIPQISFSLDMRLGARAGFKRNERMLSLDPRYVVAFPGKRGPGAPRHRSQIPSDYRRRSPRSAWNFSQARGSGYRLMRPASRQRHRRWRRPLEERIRLFSWARRSVLAPTLQEKSDD